MSTRITIQETIDTVVRTSCRIIKISKYDILTFAQSINKTFQQKDKNRNEVKLSRSGTFEDIVSNRHI